MVYRVQWGYQSGMGGPWREGNEIDIDPATAAAINVDSPGVLVAVHSAPAAADVAEPDGRRDISVPPNMRQITTADARRGPGRPKKTAGA